MFNDATGALVDGSHFKIPGRKKLAGEMDWLALMPPQPAPKSPIAAKTASPIKFQFNFTMFSIS